MDTSYLLHFRGEIESQTSTFPTLMLRQKFLDFWSRIFFILLYIMMVLSYKVITLYLSLIDSKSVKTEPFKSMNIFMYTKLSVHHRIYMLSTV